MKAHQKALARIMVMVVAMVLCGLPQYVQAQQQEGTTPQQSQQNGTTIDPSKGPLQPVPTQNESGTQNPAPQNPENSTESLPATPTLQTRPEPQVQEPLGTATAEGVPTVGGAASRPAGEAIAPSKQSQKRSLLIKMGLIAAAGVAGGTVYALTKGTSSKPSIAK
jgi:cytoskeletal protein RodZ